MSRPSSVLEAIHEIPTADAITSEHQISLIDTERRASVTDGTEDAEPSDSEAPPTPGPSPLTKRITNSSQIGQSVKRELTKRKYAKYDRGRYDINTATPPPDDDPTAQPQAGELASPQQSSFLERSRAQAKSLLKRKRTLGAGKHDTDTALDILYENQRGVFFFGIPKYSSSSLLPTDPKPWQNAQFRSSPVDIRNAQVPDPSWEWAWKSWYVDMSRDVDEEGWEYSFKFYGRWSWHGNHPWFHSFVRRRRWLRMRRRKDVKHHTREKAHELTAEYFTIHPKTVRPMSEMAPSEMVKLREKAEGADEELEKMDVSDIGSLISVLKKASVDRQKLVAVRKFVDTADDELFYLADRMPEIMALFIYQSSRRQLLANLLHRFDEAHQKQQDLSAHTHDADDKEKQQHDAATKHAENLINAVHAADEQVKKLEFWSDIKVMAQHGDLLTESEGGKWDRSKWQGLTSPTSPDADHPEQVFKNKQAASEGVRELHAHPEHSLAVPEPKGIPGERKYSQPYWDAKEDSESTQGAYVTPAESVSQLREKESAKKKGKARVSNLDGVDEGEDSESATDDHLASLRIPDTPGPERKKGSVRIVEPLPEPIDEAPRTGGGS